MKRQEPESFEVTEYSDPETGIHQKWSTISEIVEDKGRICSPDFTFRAALQGNCLKLTFHSYEMHAPTRMQQIQERAEKAMKELVSSLKKDYKTKRRETLSLKEKRDAANFIIEKVNLHERYHYACWKIFEVE